MATNKDYKKEWFVKSRVDYFSPFVNLWLACNSWYNFHYATLSGDREHLDTLKKDVTKQNVMYQKFEKLFSGAPSKERMSLFSNLELLHYSLTRAEIQPIKLKKILHFSFMLIEYSKKDNSMEYVNVLIFDARKVDGSLKANSNGIDLGEIVIENNAQTIFSGILEIIYQTRCMLVHGELEPTEENHEVVKYCYLILHDLMKDFCS